MGRPVAVDHALQAGLIGNPPPLVRENLDDRPVLVLDFDGVVSPLPTTLADRQDRGRLLFHGGNPAYVYVIAGYGVGSNYWVPVDLVHAAAELHRRFQIVWASSWGFACRPLAAMFGWPTDLPWVDLVDGFGPVERARVIRRVVGEHRATAWCDDQQTPSAQRHMSDRTGPTLCISPAKRYGLRAKHIDKLLAFADELSNNGTAH